MEGIRLFYKIVNSAQNISGKTRQAAETPVIEEREPTEARTSRNLMPLHSEGPYFSLWVLIPSTAQSGQKPVKAVMRAMAATTKTTVFRPVLICTKKPTRASTMPAINRMTLSKPPTFFFMLLLLLRFQLRHPAPRFAGNSRPSYFQSITKKAFGIFLTNRSNVSIFFSKQRITFVPIILSR
jgi:hypothetical protein